MRGHECLGQASLGLKHLISCLDQLHDFEASVKWEYEWMNSEDHCDAEITYCPWKLVHKHKNLSAQLTAAGHLRIPADSGPARPISQNTERGKASTHAIIIDYGLKQRKGQWLWVPSDRKSLTHWLETRPFFVSLLIIPSKVWWSLCHELEKWSGYNLGIAWTVNVAKANIQLKDTRIV